MLENLLNSQLLTSLALTLLHFLWQGVLVATVLKSALFIFNTNKPQYRYALSALAMLANLLLPIITFLIIYQTESSPTNYLADSFALNELLQELKQPDALFSYQELVETLPLLLPYLSVLWLMSVVLLAGKLLIEISIVNKLPKQAVVKPSKELQNRFLALAQQINLKIAPRLLISLKVDVPMAIGWLKPVVLLPANMVSGLNNAQLEMLILHELAHIRRHDYLVNFFQTIVEILLFFHPAVSWVSKQMRNEREYCSDDIAVQHCGDAIAYAHTLADTASLCTRTHHHTIPDMAMAASGGDLKQRVVRLVGHHCASTNNISKWLASATIIFSILLLSSKQLLTIPLLDVWHNPWKQVNNTVNNTKINSNQAQSSNNESNKELSNTSLAQQLALRTSDGIKQNLLVAKSKTTHKKSLTTIEKDKKTVVMYPLKAAEATHNSTDEFKTQLNNLSASKLTNPNKDNKSTTGQNSSMVDGAFERTSSKNPYQQTIVQLGSSSDKHGENNKVLNTTKRVNLLNKTSSIDKDEIKLLEYRGLKSNDIDELRTAKRTITMFTDTQLPSKNKAPSIWYDAKKLKTVNPVYPNIAKRKGIELDVEVNFTIGINGQIKDLQFIPQQKVSYFKSAIRSAIKKWRFLPAKVNGKPVESQMSKVFAFSLQR